MSNTTLTIRGNIGAAPNAGTTKAGEASLFFSVGCDDGYWNQRTGAWVEGGTSWYSVKVFGKLAENARPSLRSGDAVIVTGRVRIRDWDNGTKSGRDFELKAESIGHDLSKGTSNFMRRPRANSHGEVSAPVERQQLEQAPTDEVDEVDEETRGAWDAQGMYAPEDRPDLDEPYGASDPVDEEERETTFA